MAKVSVWDKEGKEHSKEPVDARECVEVLGWSNSAPEVQEEKQEEKKRGPKSRGDD